MQGYAKVELGPAGPDFSRRQDGGVQKAPTEIAVQPEVGPGLRTSAALAALVLGELDEDALGVLAARLAPHLHLLDQRSPGVPHVAYTVHSLAAALGVSDKVVRCAITRGELRAVKRGSRWIVPADAVTEWATASTLRRTTGRRCSSRTPKAAGPSLRSVLCAGPRGGSR